MSFTSWVDARLVNFAPVLAKAIVAQAKPELDALEASLTNTIGQQIQNVEGQLKTMLTQTLTALPGQIVAAIKGLLPFPL
jgi:hypothetical protein